MPLVFSVLDRRLSSVHLELPPSTIVSPPSSSFASLSTVCCVGSPAGTMIHTIRGAFSCLTGSPLEPLRELSQRARAGGAVLDRPLDRLLVEVERDYLMVGVAADAVHHVSA